MAKQAGAEASNVSESLIEHAMQGEPSALAELVTVVRSRPLAFPPALETGIVGAMAAALSLAPELAEFR